MKNTDKNLVEKAAYFSLSGDVNSDMVHRVFEASAQMSEHGVSTAHVLLHSHGGYVSDGICLYNFLRNSSVEFVMYNGGAVASIAVVLFLAGRRRLASKTARFMIHKSHASAPGGASPQALQIIAEGLVADDLRTESILKEHLSLSRKHWDIHSHLDLHFTSKDAIAVGLIDKIGDFSPPRGARLVNI
ncbi:MAG: ATP-dependent Clp protease proteolytic subunit [Pseudomonadota bacterium]